MNPLSDDHIDDDLLSALVDEQVDARQAEGLRAHLRDCVDCERRFVQLEEVVRLLRVLPTHDPARDFSLGPHLLADPPNVVRLQRWYLASRVAAASLAAVFVFLVAGAVYVDATASARHTAGLAPAAAPAAAPTSAPTSAAPAAAQQRAPAQQPASAPAARPATNPQSGDSTDQVAATTSVRPLPTPVPTVPPRVAIPMRPTAASVPGTADPAAAWRVAASIAGVLAALIVLTAVALRHRLHSARAALTLPLELE